MKAVTVLFLAFCVILSTATPDVVQNSFDNVNGDVTAQSSRTDDDGNTEVRQETGTVDPGTEFIPDPNAPDDSVTTYTGSFQKSRSSFTTTVDEEGNQRTTGEASDLAGNVQGNQVNDNGDVYGSQVMDVTGSDSSLKGLNGDNEVQGTETNMNLQRSKDCDGVTSYDDHVTQTEYQ